MKEEGRLKQIEGKETDGEEIDEEKSNEKHKCSDDEISVDIE